VLKGVVGFLLTSVAWYFNKEYFVQTSNFANANWHNDFVWFIWVTPSPPNEERICSTIVLIFQRLQT
jgi:hypothetical protein